MKHESVELRCGQKFNETSFQLTGLTIPFDGPNHQLSAWICLLPLPFQSRAGLFLLLALGIFSANKLSLLLLSVFASSMATLASKALLLSEVFLPFRNPTLSWSSCNCCHCAINMKSYFFLEYFFNLIFHLKGPWAEQVFYLLADLV